MSQSTSKPRFSSEMWWKRRAALLSILRPVVGFGYGIALFGLWWCALLSLTFSSDSSHASVTLVLGSDWFIIGATEPWIVKHLFSCSRCFTENSSLRAGKTFIYTVPISFYSNICDIVNPEVCTNEHLWGFFFFSCKVACNLDYS